MGMMADKELTPAGKQIALFEMEEFPYDPTFPPTNEKGKRPTARELAFIRYFFESRKLKESAEKAGYSKKNAHIIANRLIKKSLISDMIREMEDAAIKLAGITRVRALTELARLAYFDPRKLYREDKTLKDPSEWDDETAAAVASVEVFEEFYGSGEKRIKIGETKKVKPWNKNEALKNILIHLGLLKEGGAASAQASVTLNQQQKIEVIFINAPGVGDGTGDDAVKSGNGEEG